jgi:hypothetical protein
MGSFKNPRSRKHGKRSKYFIREVRRAAEENARQNMQNHTFFVHFLARFNHEVRRATEKNTCKKY